MKVYRSIILIIFLCFNVGLTFGQGVGSSSESTSKTICRDDISNVPEGWLVVGHSIRHNFNDCPDGLINGYNAWHVVKPKERSMTVCKDSPNLSNHKKKREVFSSTCYGVYTIKNAWVIEIEEEDNDGNTGGGGSTGGGGTTGGGGSTGGGGTTTGGGGSFNPDRDGDGAKADIDCDDNNANIHPNAKEIPNNHVDENCDGNLLFDLDLDGVSQEFDCDDSNKYVGRDMGREIPGNMIDDDCNGLVDEVDEDRDGFMVYELCFRATCPPEDCNDKLRNVFPGATERPNNNIDDDCDGLLDEKDEDGDGFLTYKSCNWGEDKCPEFDCDDTNDTVYPGAKDIVNNDIDENCSGKDNIVIWQMVSGGTEGMKRLNKRSPLSRKMENLLVGDFDGDEVSDILRANGTNWALFSGGKEDMEIVEPAAQLVANNMRVGDFNGDGIADLLNATGKVWRYAAGGKKPWIVLKESTVELDKMHIGDFDGDGKDDIAVISSQKVKYASGGTGDFQFANGKTFHTFGFLIGDFNGDGQDDIFNGNGEEWRVLYGATGNWEILRPHPATTAELAIGYFNEPDANGQPDAMADIFKATGKEWRVWYGGKGDKQILKTTTEKEVFLGDFDGDGQTDVFRIRKLGE